VLNKKRDLVLALFPEVCRSIIAGELNGAPEQSFTEVQRAFNTLLATPKEFKVCFIIDGVDEYNGDYNDMCQLFAQATASNDVKLLVSSRPIPSYVNAFSSCSTLRLQDLTQGDITRYSAISLVKMY
jgi:hypothetical protein